MKYLFISLFIALFQTPGSSQTLAGGIVLDRGWASPLQGGSQTMKDLGELLSPFAKPEANLAPSPGLIIFQGVTYLMPYAEAKAALNLQQKVIAKDKVVCPGLPKDSFFSYAFDGNFEGHFNKLFLVVDKAEQVVAVQLVAEAPKKDQVKAPIHKTEWHTYNFANTKSKAMISDTDAHDLIIRAIDVGVCSNRLIPPVLHEWREPRHDAFEGRNVWSLFNAFTESLKDGNLAELPKRTEALHGLLDTHVGLAA